MHVNLNRKLAIASCVSLYILAAVMQLIDRRGPELPVRLSAFAFVAFCIICIIFIVFLQKNIPYRQVRVFITAAVLLLLLWEVDDMLMMNLFPPQVPVSRYLWYAYYIFTPMIPNCTLIAARRAGIRYRDKVRPAWYATFAVSGALAVGVMTNDLHQLAFRFPTGIQAGFTDYTYGPLYYLTMGWMFLLFINCGVLMRRMIRASGLARSARFLYVVLAVTVLYFTWWVTGQPVAAWFDSAIGVSEFWMGVFLLSIEFSIRTGLIRSNFNYQELFEASSLQMQIEDEEGVRFRTADALPLTAEQRGRAMKGAIPLDADHNLNGKAITGGRVFWVEDLRAINRVREQLQETRQRLEQENDLIEAENAIATRNAKAEEQNRLYTMLARRVQSQTDRIAEILDKADPAGDDFREKMALTCIYKVFIKRLCNMELLGQEERSIHLYELRASLEESMEYLHANKIGGGVQVEGSGVFRTDALILLYSIFQRAVELTIEGDADAAGLREVQVRVRAEGELLAMELVLAGDDGARGSDAADAQGETWNVVRSETSGGRNRASVAETLRSAFDEEVRAFGGELSVREEGGTLLVSLHNINGGGKA